MTRFTRASVPRALYPSFPSRTRTRTHSLHRVDTASPRSLVALVAANRGLDSVPPFVLLFRLARPACPATSVTLSFSPPVLASLVRRLKREARRAWRDVQRQTSDSRGWVAHVLAEGYLLRRPGGSESAKYDERRRVETEPAADEEKGRKGGAASTEGEGEVEGGQPRARLRRGWRTRQSSFRR